MKALLVKSLHRKFALQIIFLTKFQEMWTKLEEVILGEKSTRLVQVTSKIRRVQWRGDLTTFLGYYEGLVQVYRLFGGKLSDTELVNVLLDALPSLYDPYTMILRKDAAEKSNSEFDLDELMKVQKIGRQTKQST